MAGARGKRSTFASSDAFARFVVTGGTERLQLFEPQPFEHVQIFRWIVAGHLARRQRIERLEHERILAATLPVAHQQLVRVDAEFEFREVSVEPRANIARSSN